MFLEIDRYKGVSNQVEFRRFSTPHMSVLLTSEGTRLIKNHPAILLALSDYRRAYEMGSTNDRVRNPFLTGREGNIYSLKPSKTKEQDNFLPILIKEFDVPFRLTRVTSSITGKVKRLEQTLERTELLRKNFKSRVPSFVRVAEQYGMLIVIDNDSENIKHAALVMQKVDGTSVEALRNSPIYKDKRGETKLSDDMRQDVLATYTELLENEGTDDEYPTPIGRLIDGSLYVQTDLDAGNVIVDFSSPTEQKPYTLWVVDQ